MSRFAEPMTRLIDELKKLPGIGSKSAQRLAFHILRSSADDAEALASAVQDVKAKLRLCSICNNITDVDPCVYCSSPTRNQKLVCVVESLADLSEGHLFYGIKPEVNRFPKTREGHWYGSQPRHVEKKRCGVLGETSM